MEAQIVLLDNNSREWRIGSVDEPIVVEKLILVPILVQPMHPSVILDPSEDYVYCTCAKCNELISDTFGYLALYFSAVRWGVRIVCLKHYKRKSTQIESDYPLIHISGILEQVIEEGCARKLDECVVCDRPNCKDETCMLVKERGILFKNRIDELMSHFYRVRLDVISPLLKRCTVCREFVEESKRVICRRCRFVFCSEFCLKRKWHKCVRIEKLYV